MEWVYDEVNRTAHLRSEKIGVFTAWYRDTAILKAYYCHWGGVDGSIEGEAQIQIDTCEVPLRGEPALMLACVKAFHEAVKTMAADVTQSARECSEWLP